ncbi:MAG: hypothetical protein IKK24_02520, partial [Clostridia bacterium]|nr:hypothetical protein [Clostridia bacterium]
KQFQAALKEGNVNSITVFAKCHHGLCYYPTEIGTMHPELDFDFTGAMVEAAQEIGVNAPIYITAGWSDLDSTEHPEWAARDKDGNEKVNYGYNRNAAPEDKRPQAVWRHLCLNDSGYCQHIYELTEEICKRYKKVDGLFYDICFVGDTCYCDACIKGMKEMGLDPENEEDALKYYRQKHIDFMKKCGDILHKYHKNGTIFFNSGGANPQKPWYHPYSTHFEMEDLPTAWGGYDKMPARAKFFSNVGKDYIGMTGKFHLDWGEFGGFKWGEALRYEIAAMATFGAGASIGDHLFPDGEMDMESYKNIGCAYKYAEKIEPYCFGGESTANIGVCFSETADVNGGISLILLENQIDFDFVTNNNFDRFHTVIVPEDARLDTEAIKALKNYADNGGNILFCADSLVADGKFVLDCGLEFIGDAAYDCDYILPLDAMEGDLPRSPFLCYLPGCRVKLIDAEVFAVLAEPQFSRTYGHFCGHRNTPYLKDADRLPAVTKKGNIVYLSHKISTIYKKYGSLYHKRYFISALRMLYNAEPIRLDIGSRGRCRMIKQESENRYCINMVYASPAKRGAAEVIEDITPLYNIDIVLNLPETVKKISVLNTGETLAYTQKDGKVSFTLPKLHCHETVIVEY